MVALPRYTYAAGYDLPSLFLSGESFIKNRSSTDQQQKTSGSLKSEGNVFRVDINEAIRLATHNNYTLQASRYNKRAAIADYYYAGTTFNMRYGVTFQIDYNKTYDRSEVIGRLRVPNTDFSQQKESFEKLFADNNAQQQQYNSTPCITVDGDLINEVEVDSPPPPGNKTTRSCDDLEEYSDEDEFASYDNDPAKLASLKFGIDKQWRSGLLTTITLDSSYRLKHYYALEGPITVVSDSDPFLLGSRFPWTSAISLSTRLPFIHSKNWGDWGNPQVVDEQLARIDAESSGLVLKATENELVKKVSIAYWELVRGTLVVGIAKQRFDILADMLKHSKRLRTQRSLREYDYKQVEAEYYRAEDYLELEWNNYIIQANNLGELLNYEVSTLLIPVLGAINEPVTLPVIETFTQSVLKNNIDLAVLGLDVEAKQLDSRHKQQQLKPDVTLYASWQLKQSDAVIGYENMLQSLTHVLQPDTFDMVVGIVYRRPLGNKGVEAAKRRSNFELMQAKNTLELARNSKLDEGNSTLAASMSAVTQTQIAARQRELAELAYDRAVESFAVGEATQFERLRKLEALITASQHYVNALVDRKKSTLNIQALQGRLVQEAQL